MESYIVRIYRYQPQQPERLVGTIQGLGSPVPLAFTGVEELWDTLKHMAHSPTDDEPAQTKFVHLEAHETK